MSNGGTRPPVIDLKDALAGLDPSEQFLGLGGWLLQNGPCEVARAIVEQGVGGWRIFSAPSSYPVDLLAGSGLLREVMTMFVSFEERGLAPNFRRACESGAVSVRDLDGPVMMAGLRAAACHIPFMVLPRTGSDIERLTPELFQDIGDPHYVGVRAICPTVTFLVASYCDSFGNAYYAGPAFADLLLATASQKVIVVVPEHGRSPEPGHQVLPRYLIDGLVVDSRAAWPLGIAGTSAPDDAAIATYLADRRTGARA